MNSDQDSHSCPGCAHPCHLHIEGDPYCWARCTSVHSDAARECLGFCHCTHNRCD